MSFMAPQHQPKLHSHGYTAQIRQKFNKSESLNSILYGGYDEYSSHYIDSLERFKKDFAVAEKENRGHQQEVREKKRDQKLGQSLFRQNTYSILNQNAFQRNDLKNSYSQYLHSIGQKKNGSTYGAPINPITNKCLQSYDGQNYAVKEECKDIEKLVRMHKLQTKGTCGYNPINGKSLETVFEKVGSEEGKQILGSSMGRYVQTFTLRAPPSY